MRGLVSSGQALTLLHDLEGEVLERLVLARAL